MGVGSAFGKTILIGDQFVLEEVPAIVAALPFETECRVERTDGEGWALEDNRIEVPGYKKKKENDHKESINRILEVMEIDVKKTPRRILTCRQRCGFQRRQLCFPGPGAQPRI